jgi:hypothetical protein
MRVIRGEPVEVWLRDGRPVRFVWRGRMYTVMFVLERRLLPAADRAVAEPVVAAPDPAAPDLAPPDLAPPDLARPDPAPPDLAPKDPAPTGPADLVVDGRECWRVEATPERTLPPATYELCHDLAADRWLLSRS